MNNDSFQFLNIADPELLADLARLFENREEDKPRQQIPIYGDNLYSALVNAICHDDEMTTPDIIFMAKCLAIELPIGHSEYTALDVHHLDFSLLASYGKCMFVFIAILQAEYTKLQNELDQSKNPILFDFLSQRISSLSIALALCAKVSNERD